MTLAGLGDLAGQGWPQLGCLGLAFVLSAAIGLEREIRAKSAGLRTHTLVGFASALMMLVSKYGFGDVLSQHVLLDPSRVAAQVVSGIGFIGAGLIFVRRDSVRGLTTAASIWLTCAVGLTAGAGLWLLALVATAGHFATIFLLTPVAGWLPHSKHAPSRLHLRYLGHHGVLRNVLARCTEVGFGVDEMTVDKRAPHDNPRAVSVWLTVHGPHRVTELAGELMRIEGVEAVSAQDADSAVP
ncbi:MgtC/SapB family protein [Sphaerisporangium sp. TRM90804]|uniref:MgtC/SapB family protein n=1 Tax=Sphaerisporangium sp. TRM90804 TaxID=3031113 RepID=UPI0024487E84|nr:MgtC/SapB family protein [Sphaerisporangium sp. TRM90804]MDH2430358.1 MgtC/SapB family protein [Sphaerisporangium sp. TRM90804]